jgi:ribonucleoside-triphosphate reductase (thioredoxin)
MTMSELPTQLQQYIHLSRYARWMDSAGRRETWPETVARYCDFFAAQYPDFPRDDIYTAIVNLEVMPSMRALMTAGPALARDHVASFNCSYAAVDHVRVFDEILYILMCGTGVGFSVERQSIAKLPIVGASVVDGEVHVPETFTVVDDVIVVKDSKTGWAAAFRQLLAHLYAARIPTWDVSKVRPAGARLKTFGGRASGPAPLVDLFQFAVHLFKGALGRKLTSVECHDLVCKIADIVVVGGVRRSALISLSNLSDDRMRGAKTGQWWESHGHRALANNSAVYTERPDAELFLKEWTALIESRAGERGIFSRASAKRKAAENGRRDASYEFGTNPCGEILLRPNGFCNLTECVVRPEDTVETLLRKVELATILGTFQSTLTNFRYLRDVWRKNAEEERLLGVSLTGIMDSPLLATPECGSILQKLREQAIATNAKWSAVLGIKSSAAITTVKPSGCRPWNALTSTSSGLLTLEELHENHPNDQDWAPAAIDLQALQGATTSPITQTYRNGVAEVQRISMSYGLRVEATPNHQWYVTAHKVGRKITPVNAWVETKDIKPGDILETTLQGYRNTTASKFRALHTTAIAMRADSDAMVQPTEMTNDIAWLLGYLWGDGAMSPGRYRVRWTDGNPDTLRKAQRILLETFGITSTIKPASQGRNAEALDVPHKLFWHWLLKNGVWKYDADRLDLIPRIVRESTDEHLIAFLSGLVDADGCVSIVNDKYSSGRGKIVITTADARFAQHVQDCAWAVGLLLGCSHNQRGVNLQQRKSMWLLGLAGGCDVRAHSILVANSVKCAKAASSADFVAWQGLREQSLPSGLVKSIETLGTMPTYDIETGNHWFYAGAVKSHNTVSQLTDSASGIHPRYAPYYIRTVRADKRDPLAQFMRAAGFPVEDDVTKPDTTDVFSFPVRAPQGSVFRDDRSAIDQLEHYLAFKRHWCEHNPSITVYVRPEEWIAVGAWVYEHFADIGGVSFLPHSDHVYRQAPYTECTVEQYEALLAQMPSVNWNDLQQLEKEDTTTGSQELACVAGVCEI